MPRLPGQPAAVMALIGLAATGAVQAGAQQPALAHWRRVADAADTTAAGPRVTASVGYMSLAGERRVDVMFASDADAYVVVGHLGADGVLRIVFPIGPGASGFVHAGDSVAVPTFAAGRDSTARRPITRRIRGGGAPADSYDGGSSYLFIVASSRPLHAQGLVDRGRWATYAVDRRDLADPHAAIAELAATLGGVEGRRAAYSLTYVHLDDRIRSTARGTRVAAGQTERTPTAFIQAPLTAVQTSPSPVSQPAYPEVYDQSADVAADAYASGFSTGYVFGFGDAFVDHSFGGGCRGFRRVETPAAVPQGGFGGLTNSSAGLFAPGFPAFGPSAFELDGCGGGRRRHVTQRYTPAVGVRADQLAPATTARPAARTALREQRREPTVFMQAPLGGPIPSQGSMNSAGAYYVAPMPSAAAPAPAAPANYGPAVHWAGGRGNYSGAAGSRAAGAAPAAGLPNGNAGAAQPAAAPAARGAIAAPAGTAQAYRRPRP